MRLFLLPQGPRAYWTPINIVAVAMARNSIGKEIWAEACYLGDEHPSHGIMIEQRGDFLHRPGYYS